MEGKQWVEGILVGVFGKIIENWMILVNYMYLWLNICQGVLSFCFVNLGVNDFVNGINCSIINSLVNFDFMCGYVLSNMFKYLGSLFIIYCFLFGLELGYGFIY